MQVKQFGISHTSISLSLTGSCKGYTWVHAQTESLHAKALCAEELCYIVLHLIFYIFCGCGPGWKTLTFN